jgi:ABC-type dipeptide/oligopeptide/nickel transport system ATPase component
MIFSARELTIQVSVKRALTTTVRGLTLDVSRGEILGLAGESGCGKSMTGRAILGILPPGAEVRAERFDLCGYDLRTLNAPTWRDVRGRKAAMVFQNPRSALNPCLTIESQLSELVRLREPELDRAHARRRVRELMDQVALPEKRLLSYPHELSGGMAQRVSIALALACRPALLIADEPTTGLDTMIQARILDLLLRLRVTNDMAIILISHDIGVLGDYADRVLRAPHNPSLSFFGGGWRAVQRHAVATGNPAQSILTRAAADPNHQLEHSASLVTCVVIPCGFRIAH